MISNMVNFSHLYGNQINKNKLRYMNDIYTTEKLSIKQGASSVILKKLLM